MNGKAFRISHLIASTYVMVLAGIATIEMAMTDLKYPIELGSGVAAAQETLEVRQIIYSVWWRNI